MTIAKEINNAETLSSQYIDSTELLLVLDWGDKSTLLLKNAIEARKILLLEYLYDIKLEHIEKTNHPIGNYLSTTELPILYMNGKIVSKGKVLSPEDIVNLVLENDAGKNVFSSDIELYLNNKKPVFGAAVAI